MAGLLVQHVEEGYETIQRELNEIMRPGRMTPATIRRLVEIMIVLHEKNPVLHRVLFEQVQLDQFREAYTRNETLTINSLAVLLEKTPQARKTVLDGPLRLAVHAVEAITHRFVLYGYEGLEKDVLIAELTDMITRYLMRGGTGGR